MSGALLHCCGRTSDECEKNPGPACGGSFFKRLTKEQVAAERERVRELIRHELYGRFPCAQRDEFIAALDLERR